MPRSRVVRFRAPSGPVLLSSNGTARAAKRFIRTRARRCPPTPPEPPGFPAEIPAPPRSRALHAVMVRCTRCDLFLSRTQVVPGAGDHARPHPLRRARRPAPARTARASPSSAPRASSSTRCWRPPGSSATRSSSPTSCAAGRPRTATRAPARSAPAPAGSPSRSASIDPQLVVTLGRFALQHFIPDGKITRLQGDAAGGRVRRPRAPALPLLHPSAVLRYPDQRPTPTSEQFEKLAELLRTGDEGPGSARRTRPLGRDPRRALTTATGSRARRCGRRGRGRRWPE